MFKFADKSYGRDVKLYQLGSDIIIDVKRLIFRKSAEQNIEDILANGIQRSNQELILDEICLTVENFKKLTNSRYKLSFRSNNDKGNNVIEVGVITLGNVSLHFENQHIKNEGEDIIIKSSNIIVYSFGDAFIKGCDMF